MVDSATNAPIAGTVAVALESGPGDFLVVMRTTADAQGNFTFNSVGTGAYAVVAEAQASSGALYVPAIVVSGNGPFGAGSTIGPGTNVGTIPLTAPSAAELLSGTVASANAGGAPVPVKVNFDPTTFVADFVFVVPNPVATPVVTSTACSGGVGACADFNVTIPAQTAFFGVFNSSGTTLQPFSSGPVYGLRAYAFSTTTGQANCSPPVQTLPTFNASPGAVLTVNPFQFTGCQ